MNSSRWIWPSLCVLIAGLLLGCGWLVPVHLRAVDATVLERAGEGTVSLEARGVELIHSQNADAGRLILQALGQVGMAETNELTATLLRNSDQDLALPGGLVVTNSMPITEWIVKLENRERVLALLQSNNLPAVRALLRTRDLTNTVLFPASGSSSGQAFDAAMSVCGLLIVGNKLTPSLRDAAAERAAAAETHPDAQPLEEVLMGFMSLGQRMTWGQLTVFVNKINDPASLTTLAEMTRQAEGRWPVLYAAVALSQKPDAAAQWMTEFSQTGLNDLATVLRFGEGGMDELLQRHQQVANSPTRERWAGDTQWLANCAWRAPGLALAAKWLAFLSAGFLLAAAWHQAWNVSAEGQGRGFHLARELLFALGFLLVLLLLSEPFLAQESQKATFAFHLRVPLTSVVNATTFHYKSIFMDIKSIITLLLFFVLQGLIYCACLVKLAEIKRQKLPARVLLKLLENEEHLFDGGLYLGFAGTIICLILVSLGVIQQSLMAAYSSTSFGIIFVSSFKIFNLRPVRRQLLLTAETQATGLEPVAAKPPTLAPVL